MSEEESSGMRILHGAFIICKVVLGHLAAKMYCYVEPEKKLTYAYPNSREVCHHQTSTLVPAKAL